MIGNTVVRVRNPIVVRSWFDRTSGVGFSGEQVVLSSVAAQGRIKNASIAIVASRFLLLPKTLRSIRLADLANRILETDALQSRNPSLITRTEDLEHQHVRGALNAAPVQTQ